MRSHFSYLFWALFAFLSLLSGLVATFISHYREGGSAGVDRTNFILGGIFWFILLSIVLGILYVGGNYLIRKNESPRMALKHYGLEWIVTFLPVGGWWLIREIISPNRYSSWIIFAIVIVVLVLLQIVARSQILKEK